MSPATQSRAMPSARGPPSGDQSHHQRHDEQHDEDHNEDLCDAERRGGETAESKTSGDQCCDQEPECPAKHGITQTDAVPPRMGRRRRTGPYCMGRAAYVARDDRTARTPCNEPPTARNATSA